MTIRSIATLAIAALLVTAAAAKAESFLPENSLEQTDATNPANGADDRLLIVNGNTGHVIYDDGRNDLFCVTRSVVVGYNEWGYPIRKRTMHCR